MQTASLLWASLTQKAKGVLMAPQTPRTIVGGISSSLTDKERKGGARGKYIEGNEGRQRGKERETQ